MNLHSFPISARWANALLLPAALVASAPMLHAQSEEDDTYMGESPDRYASVRVLEGDATIRKGDVDEPLSRGVPITEGDVVESHGRGILQLADGTRVAFGPGTRFQVAALFVDGDRDRQVLLRLDHGRLRVSMGRESAAQVRVDMPSGSGLLSDGSSASFEMERDRTARVKVHSGRMTFFNERDQASLLAGERLTVYSDQDRLDRIRNFNTYGGDSFDLWADRYLAVRRGPSWDKVPPEIRYYSDDLDDHGEWIYVEEYRSWCWRPLRVSAEWRPYWRGRWGAYPGGMTWISDEPWGYVTYHHGRWGWGAGIGWYWIPGVYYAPAWVAWQTSDVYFGWAPMGYYNSPVSWGYGVWAGGFCWNIVEINHIHYHHIHERMDHRPGVIRTFNSGSGSTGWTGGPSGNRPLTHPWQRSPLVVSQSEFRNPAQMQRVLQDPRTAQNRLRTYEQQTGKTIYRRPLSEVRTPPVPSGTPIPPPPPGAVHFEDRSPLRKPEGRPILRTETPRPLAKPQTSVPPTSSRSTPGTQRPIPKGQTVQPRAPGKGPVTQPTPLPPPGHRPPSGSGRPQEQPRETDPSGKGQAPNSTPPPLYIPPPLPPKKRPLGRP